MNVFIYFLCHPSVLSEHSPGFLPKAKGTEAGLLALLVMQFLRRSAYLLISTQVEETHSGSLSV